MRLPPERIIASQRARHHMLDDHGVEFEEAVEALRSVDRIERAASPYVEQRRYVARGRSEDGRRLNVVFAAEADGTARIITAFEPQGDKQRRRHGSR